MKITSTKCYLCNAQSPSGYKAGSAIIRVETDGGVAGHGETLMGLFCGEAAKAIVEYYEPLLIGRDPADIDSIYQLLFDSSVWWGRAGAAPSVLGAIEIALWDIKGKLAKMPVYKMLGGKCKSSVPVYASLGAIPDDPAFIPETVSELKQDNFKGMKTGLQFGDVKTMRFYSPRGKELVAAMDRTLKAIRNFAGNDFMIGIDGHSGGVPDPITREEALEVAKVLEAYDVNFFEEPLGYLDPQGYAWLRKNTKVRIAGGESLSLYEGFKTFTDLDALAVLQPDMNFVGGYTQGTKIIQLAKERGLSVLPHAWCTGPGFMSNVHFAMAFAEVERLEFAKELTDFQAAALVEKPVLSDGELLAPTAPGLGINFDAAMVSRFLFTKGTAERASGLITLPLKYED